MLVKFPVTWKTTYSDKPFEDGKLKPLSLEWSTQLSSLTPDEIKTGIEALATRTEKRFPPNAMEFKELCTGSDYESVLDAVFERLQVGQSYEWTNQLAFNFWNRYSFDLLQSDRYVAAKLVKQNLKMIDKTSMFPLPDYSQKAIEKTEDDGRASKKTSREWIAKMKGALA